MRKFSKIEKKTIRLICQGRQNVSNLLVNSLKDIILFLETDKQRFDIVIEKTDNNDKLQKDRMIIIERLVMILSLLKYLEKENVILLSEISYVSPVDPFLCSKERYDYYKKNESSFQFHPFPDDNIKGLLFKYANLIIFPTEELKAFSKFFKTNDDWRNITKNTLTIIAIIVSISIGLFGLYPTYKNMNKPQTFDEKQLLKITNSIEKIKINCYCDSVKKINEKIKGK